MSLTVRRSLRLAPMAIALASLVAPARAADFSGLVDIGGGRKMYLECSGMGSPTVVLISGKGNGAADWSEVLDPADPAHEADYDALAWGKGGLHKSESSDKPWQPRSAPKDSDPVAGVTFADWQASEKLLATSLNAKFVTKTNSGHNIYAYSPQLVIDAIREVVEDVRSNAKQTAR